jgi:methionyl-tRNA formyltransferase
MRFPPISSVILFGGAPILVAAAQRCRDRGLAVTVFTSPRHAAEVVTDDGRSLETMLAADGFTVVITDDLAAEQAELLSRIDDHCLGLGFGEAWSFPPAIIAAFGGRLLDFMGIPHPRYRGGAHYTWMILRGDRRMGCNLQVINAEMVQGEHDSGAMVCSGSYELPPTVRTPQDYFDAAVPHEVAFIEAFLDRVAAGEDFAAQLPDESRSLFLPRLHTGRNGWIDWRWSGQEIERFICAFDRPYPGAGTRCEGRELRLRYARLLADEGPFHPFQSGLVTRIQTNGSVVATSDGHLLIGEVREAGGHTVALRPGQRLFTPNADLEAALLDRVNYGATT